MQQLCIAVKIISALQNDWRVHTAVIFVLLVLSFISDIEMFTVPPFFTIVHVFLRGHLFAGERRLQRNH